MEIALLLVAVVLVVILVSRVAAPLPLPTPLALLGVGAVLSFVPAVPDVRLSSEVVLLGLLPPLLYAAAIQTSLIDIRTFRAKILSLSVGLVLFTAFGVALVAWLLLPIPFALAVALGAIVSPPDAVAATAVARRIGLPRNIRTILEGESLLNDATALVTLRTALAAAGLAAHGASTHGGPEEVTVMSVSLDLVIASLGGVAIGVVAFLLIGRLRRHLTEVPADTALSFVAPYLAYVPAEQVGASGVLAVVTAGLLLAHRAPALQSAPSRLSERINWSSLTFVLENAVFLLIGLQVAALLSAVGERSLGRTLLVGLAVLVTCLVLRPVWMVGQALVWLALHPSDPETRRAAAAQLGPRLVGRACAGWSPSPRRSPSPRSTPLRPELLVIALVVTVGTLVLQGTTLPVLARALDVRGPDPREDALMEATVLGATTGAGLRLVEADPAADPVVLGALQSQAEARVNRAWERLGTLGPTDDETPSEAQARLRTTMIREERSELLRIRAAGQVDHAVLTGILAALDAEETALGWAATRTATHPRVAPAAARPDPQRLRAPRRHPDAPSRRRPPRAARPASPRGCAGCTCASARSCGDGRVLRLLRGQARLGALPRERPPRDAQPGARRGVALVLRRRGPRLSPRATSRGRDTLTTAAGHQRVVASRRRGPPPRYRGGVTDSPAPTLLLASASPARLATLRSAGVEPLVRVSSVDEDAAVAAAQEVHGPLEAADVALLLARAKAEDVVTALQDDDESEDDSDAAEDAPDPACSSSAATPCSSSTARSTASPPTPPRRPPAGTGCAGAAGCSTPVTGSSTPATPTTAAPAGWWEGPPRPPCTSPTSPTPRSTPTSRPASRSRSPAPSPSTASAARTSAASRATRTTSWGCRSRSCASCSSSWASPGTTCAPDHPRRGLRRQTGGTSRRLSAKCRSRRAA